MLGGYWRELVRRVDLVVAGSDQLAELVRAHTAVPVTTIGDPVEGARAEARFAPPPARNWFARLSGATTRPLSLLWYGHQSNLDEVAAFLPALRAWIAGQDRVDSVELELVSASGFGAEEAAARIGLEGALRMRFTSWSMAAQQQALRDCDLVVIPATVDAAQKRVKTANRLTEALWAGRPVLAHAVPSYLEFADCAWIGEDLAAGLDVALRHPEAVVRQVRAGQDLVGRRYSPEAVGALWAQAVRGA
jgi:glycosyltransferase involved in cell wall biosynthesis